MIGSPKPYPSMVPTGADWMGFAPEHWEIQKLRHLLRPVSERKRPDLPLLSVVRERGVILRNVEDREENHNFVPDDLTNYKVVRAGQFAMNKMKAWQGSYGISRFDGLVSPAYFVFSLAGVDGEFFHCAIRSRGYVPFFAQASDGVRIGQWDLSQERMKEITFLVPPLDEQAAIVRYLDHVDRRISRYIRAKQRLIELIAEKKQVIIHRAVTRGLDLDVPLKPSGVEWLGDVPEHWEVRRIRNVAQMRVSNVDKHVKSEEIPVRLCNYVDVYKNDLIDGRLDFMRATATADEIARFLLKAGDVLITKDSETWDDIAVPALVTEPIPNLISGYHLALLRPRTGDLTGEFLLRALQSKGVAHQFHVGAGGVTRYGLSHAAIQSVWIPLPPLAEQAAIVSHLDHETTHMDAARDRAQREIELLREYRTRLMADVVTGKLDVRAAAADLPEGDETDVFDILDIDDVAEHELAPELEEVAT